MVTQRAGTVLGAISPNPTVARTVVEKYMALKGVNVSVKDLGSDREIAT